MSLPRPQVMNGSLPPAAILAEDHRARRRDPRATVRDTLDRIEKRQGDLNAFAMVDAAGATKRADELARAIEAGQDPGPLAGVPVSVKDILDVAGLPTRWGSPLMTDAKPALADVVAVARLRAAGAVIMGKTTTTEFAHSPLGVSPLTGVTRNPWAPDLTCGGSSAGAGVSVAAGLTPVALATDAGCSTRLPAACTGIFGLKPTLGRVPHDRVPEAFGNFIHLGLLAAHVRDLALALDVVAGGQRNDPQSFFQPMPNAGSALDSAALDGARVILWTQTGNTRVSEEVLTATRSAAAVLQSLGALVSEEPYPFAHPDPVWRVLQQSNWASRFAAATPEQRAQLSPTLIAGIDAGLSYRGLDLQRALVKRTELFRNVQQVFGERADFILTPCTSAPPVHAEHELTAPLVVDGTEAGDLRSEWTPYLSLFDLSGHPAIAMPAGQAQSGAPLGIQLVANWGQDAKLLAAARTYETAIGGAETHATLRSG
jgi:aspartyl-tRNA(Asn)/glutamyl-tRNA(Gln) amidotransferase subunit A